MHSRQGMRTFLLSVIAVAALAALGSATRADPLDSAEAREHAARVALAYQAQIVEIADRDILTAQIERDTAEREITRAHAAHDAPRLAYWSHRLEAIHADETTAFASYDKACAAREDARTQLRAAVAELESRPHQEAKR
jgi:hypothetical protein